MKKPAARGAAGFDHGRLRSVRIAIREGTVSLRPPLGAAGGVACRAARRCVALAHSLPQGTSAGRNLITLFSTVNNLSRSRRVGVRAAVANISPSPVRARDRMHARHPRETSIAALQASTGAPCSRSGARIGIVAARDDRTHARIARAPDRRREKCRQRARGVVLIALHKRVCAKNARAFPSPRRRIARKRKPATSPSRVSSRGARRAQCAWSSSSAYASGPSSSLSWSASSSSRVNSQPSP